MSEAKLLPSGVTKQNGGMKPRISYNDMAWFNAYERIKSLPKGTKLYAEGHEFSIDWVCGEPHPRSIWLKFRADGKLQTHIVRQGDPLLCALQTSTT